MKKIFVLFILATLCLTSCNREEFIEIEFSSSQHELKDNIVEVELNSTLDITAQIHTNVYPGPFVYWNKYGEALERLDDGYFDNIRTEENGDEANFFEEYRIPIREEQYQSGDHYVLSLRFGPNGEQEGGKIDVIIK